MLGDVEKYYPAQHYVIVDDKLRILAAIKKTWGGPAFVKQGRYDNDPEVLDRYPSADFRPDLLDIQSSIFLKGINLEKKDESYQAIT